MRGADSDTRATARAKGETAGSIMAEWKACEVFSRWWPMFSASSRAASMSMATAGPATTQASGALMVATDTSSGSHGAIASADCCTASMMPAGSPWMSCPRRATSRAASCRDMTPAMTAAANSPRLCPSTASGCRPRCCQSRASAYSRANRAGWVRAVRARSASLPSKTSVRRSARGAGLAWPAGVSLRTGLPADPGFWMPVSAAPLSRPSGIRLSSQARLSSAACGSGPMASATSSKARAKTGSCSYSCRPMPAYWAPWPENSQTSGP